MTEIELAVEIIERVEVSDQLAQFSSSSAYLHIRNETDNIFNAVDESSPLKALLKKIFCEVSLYRIQIKQELSQQQLIQLYSSLCKLSLEQANAYYNEFRIRYEQFVGGEMRSKQVRRLHSTLHLKKSSGIIGKWKQNYDPKFKRQTRGSNSPTSQMNSRGIQFATHIEVIPIETRHELKLMMMTEDGIA